MGPDERKENDPAQIRIALDQGFECEIDLWFSEDRFYLGHDAPNYIVSSDFIETKGLWIHAKNLDALDVLSQTNLNYFWHESDNYVITSRKTIWAYPEQRLSKNCIMVMPETVNRRLMISNLVCKGICTDYAFKVRDAVQSNADYCEL